jgi:hypothetical protein
MNSITCYWWNTKPDHKAIIHWYIHRYMSMVYFGKLHTEVHDLHNATFLDLTDFNELRCILIILTTFIL